MISTWFPFKYVCLANREIDFRIATGCRFSNLDTRFSTLDWSLFICIGPLPVAPEYFAACSMIGISWDICRWRQLSICLHSVHNWKQFAICSRQHRIAITDTFCATPIDLLSKHSDWDNGTLEQQNISHEILVYANFDLWACAAICWMPRWQFSLNATLPVFCSLNCSLSLSS